MRSDAVKLVVLHLLASPAVCLIYCLLHGFRDGIRIHDHKSVHVSCRSSGRLRQSSSASQEAFLVGIQDGYERYRRYIKSFPKEVDSDQHVEQTVLEVVDDFDSFQRVDIGMDIPASYSHPGEILLQLLCHPLGERRHEHSFVFLRPYSDLLQKVVHLILYRTDLDRRVQEACRPYDLLDDESFRLLQLIVRRGCADEYLLSCNGLEFVEFQRTVVCGGREAESVLDEDGFARMVAAVHGPDLRDCHMALINECDEIFREIVYQAERTHAFLSAVKIS